MAELNPVAKQIDNVSPAPIRLLLSDGSSGVFKMQNTEFLQAEFQAEGHRIDDESAYRFITSDDGEEILAGRRSDSTDEWTLVGEVLQAEAVDEDSVDHTSESDAESDTDAKSTTEETEEITLDPENVNEVNIED
ncbi:hypothetical protein [Haloquadratum walsbyi]|jgi:hypothetical protein|uniref:DUF8072 domain-containing protein n=1 Tax=Haloquadratum walsbyi J07HQW2 TaxID=1238425 RepID=U1NDC1_9EURY|nr:hypothetical protein [Haloquadratum walsbyi]ERG94950.1 MAG: hypothetical protein J07HQW2_01392 [Haloquadratum walsbyi J07HQW2]